MSAGSTPSPKSRARVTMLQLELMQQVATLRNITSAGREMGMSGSLAARQVASLERALGVRLFQRTTRSVRLTEAGERVLEWARQTLDGFTDLDDSVTTMTQAPRGLVRIAVNHYAAGSYLPIALSEFCSIYPEVQLSIVTTDQLVDLVADGFDVAVHSGRIPDSSMVGVRVRDVHRVLCASPGYLERMGVPQSVNDLTRHDCLVHSSHEPVNWFFRHGDRTMGVAVRKRIDTDSHNVLLEFVRRGLGIARLGRNIVKADMRAGRLVQVLPEFDCVYPSGEMPGMWILYPNRRLLYRTRVLVDFLAEKLATLTEDPNPVAGPPQAPIVKATSSAGGKSASGKAAGNKAANGKPAGLKAATSKAATSKAATSKATSAKATTGKAMTNDAAASKTATPVKPAGVSSSRSRR